MIKNLNERTLEPIGYSALMTDYALKALPHYRHSYISQQGRGYADTTGHRELHVYPKSYALKDKDDPLQQLEFAIKYDGINFSIMSQLFKKLTEDQVA